jgi:hypothetical protein
MHATGILVILYVARGTCVNLGAILSHGTEVRLTTILA